MKSSGARWVHDGCTQLPGVNCTQIYLFWIVLLTSVQSTGYASGIYWSVARRYDQKPSGQSPVLSAVCRSRRPNRLAAFVLRFHDQSPGVKCAKTVLKRGT